MTGIIIGLTIASAVCLIATMCLFMASLKLYTEILKAKDQRERKRGE